LIPYHGQPFDDPGEVCRGRAKDSTSQFHAYVVREGRRYTVALRNHWVWLHYTILARPSRGGPVILLERLRWDTLLLWLHQVAEEAFGQPTSTTPKGV
jgi:hypothetical protein